MTEIRETLLLEVHHAIETAAKEAVSKLGRPKPSSPSFDGDGPLQRSVRAAHASFVAYPPMDSSGPQVSPAETAALAGMTVSLDARAGLEKLFADAAAAAFFRFFCVLDGVGDPEVRHVEDWCGAVFAEPPDDEDRPMLHDEFFESYWRYREAIRTAHSSSR